MFSQEDDGRCFWLVLDEVLEYVGVYFFILAGDKVFDYNKSEGISGHEMLFKM